ncbi:MAG: SusC/RagA family TonB-linked outer membrane protein [Pedobacter sp.]|nr:SusC/RagA family TonB-linked outer membrane protein [Pedobacter sp.]
MKKLLLSLFIMTSLSFGVFAQERTVTGTVTSNEDRTPMLGVSVKVKELPNINAKTGVDGKFSLKVPANGKTLIISYLGFITREMPISTDNVVNAALKVDVKILEEIVVTGAGSGTLKKKIAFAIETISADKLPSVPTGDVGSALVGKIAGAQISSINGSPGQPVNILLRGINSIRGGTNPMILVDGVQIVSTGLENLDLNSYERIEVVQGPAAASVYGAQGANGVIQLFSKKAVGDNLNINFSSSIGNNTLLNIGGVNKAKNHSFNVNAAGEVVSSSGAPLVFDSVTGSYLTNPVFNLISPTSLNNKPYNKNLLWYDHYDMFFKSANTYNNSLSIGARKDKFDYNIIFSDNKQETVFKNNGDFRRTNLTANFGAELAKNLKFRSTTQLVHTVSSLLDQTGRNMFYAINNSRPFANYEQRDALGLYSPYFGDAVGVNAYNFNYIIENAKVKDKTIDIIQSFNLNYKFPKFLELDAKYGYNRSAYNSRYEIKEQSLSQGAEYWQYWAEGYSPRTSYGSPVSGDKSGEINNRDYISTFHNFNGNATLKFDFEQDFGMKLPITSTTFAGWDYRKKSDTDLISYGVDAPSFTPYSTKDMATFQTPTDYKEDFATYGYIINQKFDYSDIGGFSVGFRSDYSSAFGRGSKPFTFPRADAYLNLSSFNFFQKSKLSNTLTDVKFRAAYGEAGIQPGAYDRFPILNTATIGAQSALVTPNANANPDLQVEVSKELEVGTDMKFSFGKNSWFRNLGFSFTYWDRTSENIIDQIDVAPSIGLGRLLTNSMSIKSQGIQASFNSQVFTSKNLTWGLNINFAKQTSKIDKINGGAEIIKTSAAGSATYVIKEGEKIGQLYGYLFINQVDAKDPNGNLFIPVANQPLWEVASNGYVVNKTTKQPFASSRKYAMGDPNPKFNMSFINDINYKGFLTLGVQLDWLYKSNLYNQTKQWMYRDGIHNDYDKPITINGQTEAYSAFYRGAYAVSQANGTKSYFYEDASFLRLRNISLGIDIAHFKKIKGISKCQLVLSGRNLFTVTKYTGMDPEVSSGTINSSFDRGVDHNTIPNLKTYQIGLNIGLN